MVSGIWKLNLNELAPSLRVTIKINYEKMFKYLENDSVRSTYRNHDRMDAEQKKLPFTQESRKNKK